MLLEKFYFVYFFYTGEVCYLIPQTPCNITVNLHLKKAKQLTVSSAFTAQDFI
jgi:hypothetical protein